MSTSLKAKRQKTGEGAVSTWPKFSERLADQKQTTELFTNQGYLKVCNCIMIMHIKFNQ